jgi:DNA repair exonuclease SbcCD ATPase subunit
MKNARMYAFVAIWIALCGASLVWIIQESMRPMPVVKNEAIDIPPPSDKIRPDPRYIKKLEQKINDLDRQVEKLTQGKKESSSHVQDLLALLKTKEEFIRKTQTEIRQGNTKLKKVLADVEREKADLQKKLSVKQSELDALGSERDKLVAQKTELTKRIHDLTPSRETEPAPDKTLFNFSPASLPGLLREKFPSQVLTLSNYLEKLDSGSLGSDEKFLIVDLALKMTGNIKDTLNKRYESTDLRRSAALSFLEDIEAKLFVLRK